VRDALVRRLQALAGTSTSTTVSNNDGTRIALNYEGDVEALGRRIDFAAVLTIDAATRTIELRVDADEL